MPAIISGFGGRSPPYDEKFLLRSIDGSRNSKLGIVLGQGNHFYFVAENLVLPPGCRPTGRKLGQVRAPRLCRESAASGSGMMEYWNDGMLGLVD